MAEKTLIAIVRPCEHDRETMLVVSPVVGTADGVSQVGAFLNAFDRISTVTVLHERHVLRLPRDVRGRVVETFIPNAYTPVAYGQRLARLDPRGIEADCVASIGADGHAGAVDQPQLAGVITVKAPSDGIFYRSPSPDSPPYVEEGSSVVTGSTLGLVEIMKCLHHITYGGPGVPEQGKITKILAENASEVSFGQMLFQIAPMQPK